MLAISAMLVSGCTTQMQRIGADDGSDVCHSYRAQLDSTGNYFGEDIAKGAVLGALGGALTGALLSGGQNVGRAAAIGAAGGLVLGAAGGYWAALHQQQQDQAQLYRTVLTDMTKENAQIDSTQLAFNQLVDCRRNSANQVRADLAAGRITRTDAEARMATIKRLHDQDLQIARNINGKIAERSTNFQFATEQLTPQPYVALGSTPLHATADVGSPAVAQLSAGRIYRAAHANDTWVKVLTDDGREGYVDASLIAPQMDPRAQQAIAAARPPVPVRAVVPPSSARPRAGQPAPAPAPVVAPAPVAPTPTDDVSRTAFTNLSKKTGFADSVQVAANDTSSFELAPTS